jgi:hypothetical protein
MRLPTFIVLSALALSALSACGDTSEASGKPGAPAKSKPEFALYALSRGKGVPEPTRDAFNKARNMLVNARARGEVVSLAETRIGLEGETKLCVQAKDASASRKLQGRVRQIGQDVDLFNVVEEACSSK